jgi:hypothetical protein
MVDIPEYLLPPSNTPFVARNEMFFITFYKTFFKDNGCMAGVAALYPSSVKPYTSRTYMYKAKILPDTLQRNVSR